MTLKDFFIREKIYEFSLLPFGEVTVIDQRKADRMFENRECETVVPFLIPYLVNDGAESNISVYAHSRDYHFYFKELSQRLKDEFGDIVTACDVSPINEVECAVRAGLGSIGKNGLLINPRYGTYVFVAEAFFSVPLSHSVFDGIDRRNRGHFCLMCGKCEKACPTQALTDKTKCVSYINQKKRLDEGDSEIITASGSVWGCDICQQVCPCNKDVDETEIDFFREDRTPYLTDELLDKMTEDGSFSQRAYAWRGEAVVRRNIALCRPKENVPQ